MCPDLDRLPQHRDGHLLGNDEDTRQPEPGGRMTKAFRDLGADDDGVRTDARKNLGGLVDGCGRSRHLDARIPFEGVQDLLVEPEVSDGDGDAGPPPNRDQRPLSTLGPAR